MKTILHLILVLIPAVFVLVLGMAVVIGFGLLLTLLLPLSLYQASLLTVMTALVLVFISFVMTLVSRIPPGMSADLDDDDWGDEEDEVEDNWGADGTPLVIHPTLLNKKPNVGRNSLCPCGSGKKFKHCCGL